MLMVAAVPEPGVSLIETPVTWLGPLLYTVPEKLTRTPTTLFATCRLVLQLFVTPKLVLNVEVHVFEAMVEVTVFVCVELPFGTVVELSPP